ncbi:hypothetical protein ES288_1Z037800v1 [Gossypium darwinii]|uniref:Uncharacterized protein n=1 Tax=Gossypium darwinii TaxID=34276 RepID=A0A5C7IZ27_GOSDA|nr:hypothetical protein ES288_1Z037800v1 [Gossypium darwinii]
MLTRTIIRVPTPTLPRLHVVEPDPDDGEDNLPETRHIPEELLNILDDSDPVSGPDPAIQGLDSVIRSFEEEILIPEQVALPETVLDSGESRPELGFLFEASDDELGLPPSLPAVEVEQRFETAFDVDEGGGQVALDLGKYGE